MESSPQLSLELLDLRLRAVSERLNNAYKIINQMATLKDSIDNLDKRLFDLNNDIVSMKTGLRSLFVKITSIGAAVPPRRGRQ